MRNSAEKRRERYSQKPLSSFSAAYPWFVLPFRPRTARATFRLIFTVLRDFFWLQQKQKLHLSHRPVIFVDTDLDEKIPFVPGRVRTYMSFIGYFIRPLTMLIKRLGFRNAAPYVRLFEQFIAQMYKNAACIYRFCLTTTRRPRYTKMKEFRTIYLFDPHFLCVPSLHVTIAAGTYAWFRQCFETGILPKDEAEFRLSELKAQAIAITESVLLVKQHSVNCVPLALYMLSATMGKSFFPIEAAVGFTEELFVSAPELTEDVRTEIHDYFHFMYERTMLEKYFSDNWQDGIKRWLLDFAEKTGQKDKFTAPKNTK